MNIGINGEGRYDEIVLSTIIPRMVTGSFSQLTDINCKFYPARGSLHGQVKKAASMFFEYGEPLCHLAVFVTDTDNDDEKCRKVRGEVASVFREKGFLHFVVGCVTPELEQWFLDEQDTLKNMLAGLSGSSPLPTFVGSPKEKLEQLFAQYPPNIGTTKKDRYRMLAENLDINNLATRNKDFKKFRSDLISEIRTIIKP